MATAAETTILEVDGIVALGMFAEERCPRTGSECPARVRISAGSSASESIRKSSKIDLARGAGSRRGDQLTA